MSLSVTSTSGSVASTRFSGEKSAALPMGNALTTPLAAMKADLRWSQPIGVTHSINVERAFWLFEQMERLGKRFGKLLQHWRAQISKFCENKLVRVKESLIYAL